MVTKGLTKRMAELRDFIAAYLESHAGVSPSYREMMAGLGLKSASTIHRMLMAMNARGVIASAPRRARTVTLKSETSLEVASEHIAWAIRNGTGLRQVLESILGSPPAHTSLHVAIEQVAVAWEKMQETRP